MSLDKLLEIYKNWIQLYIEYSFQQGRTEEEIQDKLDFYRPPTSENDYMCMVYCHDSIESSYDEDWRDVE